MNLINKFNEYLRDRNYIVDYKIFTDNFILIVKNIPLLIKRHRDHQVQILDTFSKKNWEKMSLNKKNAHSLFNCNGCLQDTKIKGTLGLFFFFGRGPWEPHFCTSWAKKL